ncbi:unnamed protein product [Acanthoscelides obtectus]|uniref:Uncharacterized protein n=1 Tax=Acanthoscelides obtectus TaxID=200917 RepID=A0A9P0PEZ3_ACAOB|nr:unnamed protein product [Acanthoscelides obtectus]CAK1631858.1 Odorant receptor 85b [Acanthoscelides obtectus]
MEQIFSMTTLLQTASSLFMVASNIIIVSTLSTAQPEFWCIVHFVTACIIQLHMVCHFGSGVTEMCFYFRRITYECEWYSCSKRFKTCMLMMMVRMDKPMYLTAGKFFPLTYGTIITVVRAAYSYAAMFRNVG